MTNYRRDEHRYLFVKRKVFDAVTDKLTLKVQILNRELKAVARQQRLIVEFLENSPHALAYQAFMRERDE